MKVDRRITSGFLAGAVIGAAAAYMQVKGRELAPQGSYNTSAERVDCSVSSGDELRAKIEDVSSERDDCRARLEDAAKDLQACTEGAPLSESVVPTPAAPPEQARSTAAQWRVSAIEKFVPLSEDQRERLKRSFEQKQRDEDAETLEEIIGKENAKYYREQVSKAFDRMREQELEKEILLTSRRLELTQEQENRLRTVYETIESEIASSDDRSGSPQERVAKMVEENKRRAALRSARVKELFTQEQYTRYLQDEAESPEADLEVFHDTSGGSSAAHAP